jgi:two-component system sensor histidine kinase DesK
VTVSTGAASGPTWAVRGLRPWTILVWLPLCYSLLIAPIADSTNLQAWSPWLVAAAAACAFTGAVGTRFRPGPRQQPVALFLLAALMVLAVTATAVYSSEWSSLFVLLAIGVGVVVGARAAPYAVLLLTVVATVSVLLTGDSVDSAASTGLTVAMSGLGTYAFHQLFAVVAELRCTREELARVAVSQERERFARDLHDLLGHTLSVIVVKAEAVRRLASRDSVAAAGHAADIETIGREALADIRRAASGYRGPGLERELARAQSALDAAGVACSIKHPPAAADLPERADVLLGWVVREGVTNVVRHAHATRCAITIERSAASVRLRIDDDGPVGEPSNGSGAGLSGLEERVTAAGGRFAASRTGDGFRLAVDVPCQAEPVQLESAAREPVPSEPGRAGSDQAEVTAG